MSLEVSTCAWLNPYCFLSMHFSTDSLVENRWIDDLEEQQATRFIVGWNTMEVMVAFDVPRLNTCNFSPESALNTSSFVPLIEAVQIRVPSGFTEMKATSLSWA